MQKKPRSSPANSATTATSKLSPRYSTPRVTASDYPECFFSRFLGLPSADHLTPSQYILPHTQRAEAELNAFTAYELAVCTVLSESDPHFREWLAFYKAAGAARFYIFTGVQHAAETKALPGALRTDHAKAV